MRFGQNIGKLKMLDNLTHIDALIKSGQYTIAENIAVRLHVQCNNAASFIFLSNTYIKMHRHKDAERIISKGIKRYPTDRNVFMAYLKAKTVQGDIEGVLNYYLEYFLESNEDNYDILFGLLNHALSEYRFSLALKIAQVGAILTPETDAFYYIMAREFFINSDYKSASRLLKRVLQLSPYNSRCQTMLSATALDRGDWASAVIHSKFSIITNPEAAINYILSAACVKDSAKDARNYLEKALKIDKNSPFANFMLADIFLKMDNSAEFLNYMMIAVQNASHIGNIYATDSGFFIKKIFSTAHFINMIVKIGIFPDHYRDIFYLEMADFERFCRISNFELTKTSYYAPTNFCGMPGDVRRFRDFINNIDSRGVLISSCNSIFVHYIPGDRERLFSKNSYLVDIIIDKPKAEIPTSQSKGTKFSYFGSIGRLINNRNNVSCQVYFDNRQKIVKIDNKDIVFIQSTDNYGHYVQDFFTKFMAIYAEPKIFKDKTILCKKMPSYAKEMIKVFGFEELSLNEIDCKEETTFYFSRVTLIGGVPYGLGISFLRSRYTELHGSKNSKKYSNLIYLSRGNLDESKQRIYNEGEVSLFLKSIGFDIIYCSETSVAETAEAVHGADIIVSSPGAQTSNLVFAKENAVFIELYNPMFEVNSWWSMGQSINYTFNIKQVRVYGLPVFLQGDKKNGMDMIDIPCRIRISELSSIISAVQK